MCLHSIKERNDNPSTMIISGWKEFNGSGKSLRFQNQTLNLKYDVPLDKWITAEKKAVKGSPSVSYESGFHVWINEKELGSNYKYRRVYIRKIQTIGVQGGLTVAVADEIYVPSNPDDWPPKPKDPPKKDSILEKTKKMIGKVGNA
jgi:hypothetical protein